jgi:hypothetical protein
MSNPIIDNAKPVLPDSSNGNGSNGHEWPEPKPVKAELLAVEPLPIEILPEPIRLWIKDVAYRMQCPPDFVAMAFLVLVSSIIGTRCSIHPKQKDNWECTPNLWGGVIGSPSTKKSPSINEGLKPLARLEIKAKEKYEEDIKQHMADLLEVKAKKDSLNSQLKAAVKSEDDEKLVEDIKNKMINLKELRETTLRRYKTNDATIEKLSELCNENPEGLLVFRDELIGLIASWDKPGRESDRAFFLEGWNGDGSHTSDRIGRGTTFTEHLCLAVFGGIQPSKLIAYLYQCMKGLENDGLFQRFQLLVYPDEIKDWELVDEYPDKEARERVFNLIERLAEMDFKEYGAVKGKFDKFPSYRFSDEAQTLFYAWLTDLELNKLRGDDHPILLEHFGKYGSLMPSLALIFHLIDIADGANSGPVSLQAAEKAAGICDYLESHARRIYGLVSNINQQAAARLAKNIQTGKLTDGFTTRDVYRKEWQLLDSAELATSACDELIDLGWLITEQPKSGGVGKKPLPIHHINPKIKNMASSKTNTD